MRPTTLISCLGAALMSLSLSTLANETTKVETSQGDVKVTSGQPNDPPPMDAPGSVAELDQNGDGAISLSEAKPSLDLTNEFDLADNWVPAKRDGKVTEAELQAWLRNSTAGSGVAARTEGSGVMPAASADTSAVVSSGSTESDANVAESTDSLSESGSENVAEADDSDLEPGDNLDADDEAVNDDELDGDTPDQNEPDEQP
jgi:hypothetical protein